MTMREATPEESKGVHDYIEGISEKVIPLTEEAYSDLCLRAARYEELKQAVQEIREEARKIPCEYLVNSAQGYFELGKDAVIRLIDRKLTSYSDIPNK